MSRLLLAFKSAPKALQDEADRLVALCSAAVRPALLYLPAKVWVRGSTVAECRVRAWPATWDPGEPSGDKWAMACMVAVAPPDEVRFRELAEDVARWVLGCLEAFEALVDVGLGQLEAMTALRAGTWASVVPQEIGEQVAMWRAEPIRERRRRSSSVSSEPAPPYEPVVYRQLGLRWQNRVRS